MPIGFIRFEQVVFAYDSMSEPLLRDFNVTFHAGWTGIVGPNGAGKTTVLGLACGLLEPVSGHVWSPGDAVLCEQRTDEIPHDFTAFIADDGTACELKGRLGIRNDWSERWDFLSHGERKRAQIATALWRQPEILALDEPTNHIDAETRDLLIGTLRVFRGIGLLVSHDRELLDTLCDRCLFIDPPDITLRPGNYSDGKQESERDEVTALRQREKTRQRFEQLQAEAQRRAQKAQQADRKRSKRGLAKGDSDGRARIDLARVTGMDGRAGVLAERMNSRVDRARRQLSDSKVKKRYESGIWVEGERCRRDTLFRLSAGTVPLGKNRCLHFPDLSMRPDDRIALTGANGAGKSTLLGAIHETAIHTGASLPDERVVWLPQEIMRHDAGRILEEARRQPRETLGTLLMVVRRLGSDPARLLESSKPSPGELRKLLLAIGISRRPWLIVMDEPTNHLDLPSVECLEDAMRECNCGLLLVSHDELFLSGLARTRWHITQTKDGDSRLRMEIV